MNDEVFPSLKQVLGCYFHQDWIYEFPDVMSVLAAIRDSISQERCSKACSEIRSILSSDRSDAEVTGLLHGPLGCYVELTSIGLSAKEWLALVARSLEEKR